MSIVVIQSKCPKCGEPVEKIHREMTKETWGKVGEYLDKGELCGRCLSEKSLDPCCSWTRPPDKYIIDRIVEMINRVDWFVHFAKEDDDGDKGKT